MANTAQSIPSGSSAIERTRADEALTSALAELKKSATDYQNLAKDVGKESLDQHHNRLRVALAPYAMQAWPYAGTVVDGSTTNTNFNLGTSAVWTYTPHAGGYRSALTGGGGSTGDEGTTGHRRPPCGPAPRRLTWL